MQLDLKDLNLALLDLFLISAQFQLESQLPQIFGDSEIIKFFTVTFTLFDTRINLHRGDVNRIFISFAYGCFGNFMGFTLNAVSLAPCMYMTMMDVHISLSIIRVATLLTMVIRLGVRIAWVVFL